MSQSRPDKAVALMEPAVATLDEPGIRLDPGSTPVALPRPSRIREVAGPALLALAGTTVLIVLWQAVASARPHVPSPFATLSELLTLASSPLRNAGPNIGDKGILVLIGASLTRLFSGFAIAAAVGIPLGFAVGAVEPIRRATNPIIQVLRPVSPLAWFPIALALFAMTPPAAVFTIAITALWPILLNTAHGVGGVPRDHRNVAKVFRFSRSRYVRQVLLPYSMGSIVTGLRVSMGVAWMVLVAVEMLAALPGIGGFVWDSYNNSNMPAVASAILFIGVVGFGLDLVLSRLARKFDYAASQ
jgi:nitrate/nitrite transport system permease protein